MRRFSLVLFFVLLPAYASATGCSVSGFSIIFINGVFDTKSQADLNSEALQNSLGYKLNNEPVTVFTGYNQTHLSGGGDILETKFPALDQYDLDTILMQIQPEVTTQKVLVVGHSQGAQYANKIYDYLTTHGLSKDSVAVYVVATPERYVAGGGKYINYGLDQIINSLAKLGGFNIPPANLDFTDFPPGVGPEGATQGHGFVDIYLAGAGDRMVSEMKQEMSQLKASGTTAADGCFDVPKKGVSYVASREALALADPLTGDLVFAGKIAVQATVIAYKGISAAVGFAGSALGSIFSHADSAPHDSTPTDFDIVGHIYGSSLNAKDVKELLGESQGGAVALALHNTDDTAPPAHDGEVLGAGTEATTTTATTTAAVQESTPTPAVLPQSPAGSASATGTQDPLNAAPSAPVTPSLASVSSDGFTYTPRDVWPINIVLMFNTDIATATVSIDLPIIGSGGAGDVTAHYELGDCNDSDAKTLCVSYTPSNYMNETFQHLTITASTTAGALITDSNHFFTVDTSAPFVTLNSPIYTNSQLPTITGLHSDPIPMDLSINGKMYTFTQSGNFSFKIPAGDELPEGTYDVVASTSPDSNGNVATSTAHGTLVVDTTPSVLTVLSGPGVGNTVGGSGTTPAVLVLSSSDVVAAGTTTVTFSASDTNLTWAGCAFDSDTTSDCLSTLSLSKSLDPGLHSYHIDLNDKAVNVTEIDVTFTVQ
ncbi:MAG: hypothetical protein KGI70_01940 [Patescibacteria group bacterium]|nr:hypothetical protein [Patescibacteria group bacterium]